jgi:hypothetical protein
VQLAPREEIPPAVGADLDDVAGELVVRGAEPFELARVDDATPVGLPEVLAVDVGDVANVPGRADRTVVRGGVADVAGCSQELGVRIAHVEPGDGPAAKVTEDGPTGQRVVGVPAHGATVPVAGAASRRFGCSRDITRPFTVCILVPIYRVDISNRK